MTHNKYDLLMLLNLLNDKQLQVQSLTVDLYNELSYTYKKSFSCKNTESHLWACVPFSLTTLLEKSKTTTNFSNDKPFGGISIICSGDFYQLKPVLDTFVFKVNPRVHYAVLSGTILWENFCIYELTECMRQKKDKLFAEALDNFGSGELNENQKKMFLSRVTDKIDDSIPNIFRTNLEVDKFNDNFLDGLKSTYECQTLQIRRH